MYRELAGGGYEVMDLVAARRGDPDPWHQVLRPARGVVDLRTVGNRGLYVSDLPVAADDMAAVDKALRLAPREGESHDPEANGRREAAGREALKVRDVMVRARLLDAIDGWSALMGDPARVIERTDEGTLCRAPEGMTCFILVVRCPSTARIYAHRVPSERRTVAEARKWLMRGHSPEVET